ncbi:MAG: dihydrolipoyl dehydrogenase [Rhodospirillales bacterium]|nr:MAG: dihydrolipoyl dehydrogenase [Rhodospirillales bacterium]
MDRRVDVAVIGAGTAGLHALSEIRKETENVVLINGGPLGTTCARVGCMPSKVMIQVADDYHRRDMLAMEGIGGGDGLRIELPTALAHVRRLRDRFVEGVLKRSMRTIGDRFIDGYAEFLGPDRLRIPDRDMTIQADAIVIATGSRPVVPPPWRRFGDRILTTDTLFEQEDLPPRLAVLGLGAIGTELGQALARMGLAVTGFDMKAEIGGLTDPEINDAAVAAIGRDFPLHLGATATVEADGNELRVAMDGAAVTVDRLLVAVGRRPNLDGLHLERLGVALDETGAPPVDGETMQIGALPVFLAGDALPGHPAILHEAAHDGRIAGYNAVRRRAAGFRRRTPLAIAFTDPQLCSVGATWPQLKDDDPAVGSARFTGGRAAVMLREEGLIRLYADRSNGRLLGASMAAPGGEHLAHLLAWCIQDQRTVFDLLEKPFYHPVLEETLEDALRDLAGQVAGAPPSPLPGFARA